MTSQIMALWERTALLSCLTDTTHLKPGMMPPVILNFTGFVRKLPVFSCYVMYLNQTLFFGKYILNGAME